MLGRTARFLRLLGYDTLYSNSFSDPELLEIAKQQDRILLTRDVELHQRAVKLNIPSCLLSEKDYIDRITTLTNEMNLQLELNPTISRCATCNARIKPIPKKNVEGKVPKGTFSKFDEFWVCTNTKCGKIYYQGPHWVNITKTYEEIKERLNKIKE